MATAAQLKRERSATPVAGSFCVLGVRVDAVQIPDVITRMEEWIARRDSCRYIAVTGMHGVMESQHDPKSRQTLDSAALVVPDGYPLVWLGRRKGFSNLHRRVYGPELMDEFCSQTKGRGYRHFFYGGAPGVADDLARKFVVRHPGLTVAGTFSPPFRELTDQEDVQIREAINGARPDIVWVGLSTPKQELWMFKHSSQLNATVLVGVGAAFDFHSGRVAQAPVWMREHGFEWLFRLLQEPRRLWKRYLLYGSEFALFVILESLGLKKS